MVTYLYWLVVFALCAGILYGAGYHFEKWKIALSGTAIILLIGSVAYFFHFQQLFVKRYGGVMTIRVPDGQHHVAATWKDDNLWIENYDPKTNSCHFREYSRGNMLEGTVIIKNCNPLRIGNQ